MAREKQTRELGTTLLPFELLGTAIAERLMEALAVIEHLDIFGDGIAGFGLMSEASLYPPVERDGANGMDMGTAFTKKVGSDALTEREREIIRLVGQGLSNQDIAYKLSISDSTARHHMTNIF